MSTRNLADAIYQATLEWGEKYFGKKESLSPEQEKWKKFFSENTHSCDQKFMIAYTEALTGVDMSFTQKDKYGKKAKWTFGIAVVPVGNSNAHNYNLGRAAICLYPASGIFVQQDGVPGNHLSDYIQDLRLPELEEIEDCLKALAKKNKLFYAKLEEKFLGE